MQKTMQAGLFQCQLVHRSLGRVRAGTNGMIRGTGHQLEKVKRKEEYSIRKKDTLFTSNQRAKMKRVNFSSSSSQLLMPPSILASSSGGRFDNPDLQGARKPVPSDHGATAEGSGNKTLKTSLKELTEQLMSFSSCQYETTNAEKKQTWPIALKYIERQVPSNSPSALDSRDDASSHGESVVNQCLPLMNTSLLDYGHELPLLSYTELSSSGPPDRMTSTTSDVSLCELFYQSTQSTLSFALMNTDISPRPSVLSVCIACIQENRRDDRKYPPVVCQSGDSSTLPDTIDGWQNEMLIIDDAVTGVGIGMEDRVSSDIVMKEMTVMVAQELEEQCQFDERDTAKVKNVSDAYLSQEHGSGADGSSKSFEEIPGSKPRNRKSQLQPKAGIASGRKMVRRGMEMLVGGEPINADPPQRSIELNYYRKHPNFWVRSITTNSPDFGPLLHMHSAGKVMKESIGIFCEHFAFVTEKWGICPDDLRFVVTTFDESKLSSFSGDTALSVSDQDREALVSEVAYSESQNNFSPPAQSVPGQQDDPEGCGAPKVISEKVSTSPSGKKCLTSYSKLLGLNQLLRPNNSVSGQNPSIISPQGLQNGVEELSVTLGGKLEFSFGVSKSDLLWDDSKAFRRVLSHGVGLSIEGSSAVECDVVISDLIISDVEGGSSDIVVQFQLTPTRPIGISEAQQVAKDINCALACAIGNGKMALAMARKAQKEKVWPTHLRTQVAEQFLFEAGDDHDRCSSDDIHPDGNDREYNNSVNDNYEGPFGMEGDAVYAKDDIWLGQGNGGVFFDYSCSNRLNSPYQGKLGPYLVDAVTERAQQNQPRVIAVGDVHGCIDELTALLRKCDYHPGDLVVFLGDLVCKGPDSLSVVQLAREVGAIGVRGNHDFEVVRWHQAIKSGADPPVIGSEHYYVASALHTADLKWMYSLPWFISSSHLNALFVHAGFVSGIRLAKQNPRLMMNMRSILPDGTVTSKFFNNWPWARLWDGPQTVFFGHDADRGLQQYEHAIGLDTGCVYGGKLTACILPERRLVSVNAKQEYFQYRRKHFD